MIRESHTHTHTYIYIRVYICRLCDVFQSGESNPLRRIANESMKSKYDLPQNVGFLILFHRKCLLFLCFFFFFFLRRAIIIFYREELERKAQVQNQLSRIKSAAHCNQKSSIFANRNCQEYQETSRFSSFNYASMRAKTRDNNRMARAALMRASTHIEGRKLERATRTRKEHGKEF